VHTQFPQLADQELTDLRTAGTVNAIFRIGHGHTARFPLRRQDPTACHKHLTAEVAAMEEFAVVCPVQTPRAIGIGQPDTGFPMPWLLQTWIDGTPATPWSLCSSSDFARDLARLVLSLREADLKNRSFDGNGRGGRLRDHDDWMEVCFSNSEDILDVPDLRTLWFEFRKLPPPDREVMSHKDLTPANLLIKGGHLVGVLDAGSFGPADPALDLIAGWHLLDRDRRSLFFDMMGADAEEYRRSAAWAFVQALGLVWYYRESNPTMSTLGRSTLARLKTDA